MRLAFFLSAIIAGALAPVPAFACGDEGEMLGNFYGGKGPGARDQGQELIIDRSFVAELARHPLGAVYERNRNELHYLISIEDRAAQRAGLRVLAHLLAHPTIVTECDAPHELYRKEDLAIFLSASYPTGELCKLDAAERDAIIDFYGKHPALWRNVDPVWMPGNACNPIEVTP